MASLSDVVEAVVSRLQLDLESVKQVRAGSRIIVQIAVDGDGASGRGLSLDEVAAASQEISRALDDTGVMGEKAYVLEVGTRGVDAPLTRPAHWRRNTGRLVRITKSGGGVIEARIMNVDNDTVRLSDGQDVRLADVAKAHVQVEMNRHEDEEESWTSI